jgi:hypothetical protein
MEDTYYLKYIKYKTKYINLRETQTGGGFWSDLFRGFISSKTSPNNLNNNKPVPRIGTSEQFTDESLLTYINAKKEVIFKKIKECKKIIIPNGMLAKLDILIDNIEVNINGKKSLLTIAEKEGGKFSTDVKLQMAYKRWHEKLWNMKHLLDKLEKTIELCNISDLEKIDFQIDKLWNE